MTYVPPNRRVSGWWELAGPDNSYAALFFDPNMVETELERPLLGIVERPMFYFQHAQLAGTLRHIAALAQSDDALLQAETLGLFAVLQLYPSLGLTVEPSAGRLGLNEQIRVRDYVQSSLGSGIYNYIVEPFLSLGVIGLCRLNIPTAIPPLTL